MISNEVGKIGGLTSLKLSIERLKTSMDTLNGFLKGCANVLLYVKNFFHDPTIYWNSFVGYAPQFFLIVFTVLIILRFIGFEKVTKWITLSALIAFLTSMIGTI